MATLSELDSLDFDKILTIYPIVNHIITEQEHRYLFMLDVQKHDKLINSKNYINNAYFRYLYRLPDQSIVKEYKKYIVNPEEEQSSHIFITKIQAITELVDKRKLDIIKLHLATDKQVNQLINITKNVNIMKFLDQKKWTKDYILNLVKQSSLDESIAIPYKMYFHWLILDNDKTVGYVGLHPAFPALDPEGLQIRVFTNQFRKGYASFGISEAIFAYRNKEDFYKPGFGQGHRTIYSIIDPDNEASILLFNNLFDWSPLIKTFRIGKILYKIYKLN